MPPQRSAPAFSSTELRRLLQTFIREFGLLEQDGTPCGKPLATSHAHALMILLDDSRTYTQKDLADELGIDKSNVTRLCQKMEGEGQIEQVRGDDDGRVRMLKLTARGAKLAGELEKSSKERFSALLKAVPTADRARLFEGLELLTKAVSSLRSGE